MKNQNLLFIPFIFCMGMGLFSCDMGGGGNSQTFQNTPAVVDLRTDMGGITLGTPWGNLSAPSLVDVSEGDCIYMHQFTIDYDNQPSDKYYTASNIVKEKVNQTPLVVKKTIDIEDYLLPLSKTGGMVDEFLQGRLFVWMSCKDKNPAFRLIYNTEEEVTNGVMNMYLQTRPSSTTENAEDVSTIHAFNLLDFIQQNGRDTTKTLKDSSDKHDFKYIKMNLNYVSKIKDGVPEYSTLNSLDKPIEIYIFRKGEK